MYTIIGIIIEGSYMKYNFEYTYGEFKKKKDAKKRVKEMVLQTNKNYVILKIY